MKIEGNSDGVQPVPEPTPGNNNKEPAPDFGHVPLGKQKSAEVPADFESRLNKKREEGGIYG